ncbi:MAG: hypothetical protein OEN56_12085 [Gemmatimonadota bacterium]|nr:hypothetical protein [Gemmatimonadota bacterium]
MIKPKPKPSSAPSRAMAVVVTLALMMSAYVGLKGLAVPAFASGRDVIREIDPLLFERYAAPPPPEETPLPDTEEEPVEAEEEPTELVPFDREVGLAVEQLERMFATDEPAAPTADRASAANAAAPGISEEIPNDRFEALFGRGGDLGAAGVAGARSGRAGGEAGGVGLGITERASADVSDSGSAARLGEVGPGLEAITETRRAPTVESSEVVIGRYEPESFDGSAAEQLGAWMREHPSELPVGVRVHMNFQPSFLTSAVSLTTDGQSWELYLMFNESLRELHIVLVEAQRSIYMIDRGFREESRSLREGTVRRADGQIVAVDSRSAATSGERAQDFYNVFLSWWESVKDDVGSS